jgi:hypothetical protein
MFLPQARFAFTETTPPSGTELMAWGWNSGWRLGSKMFPRGAPDGLPAPTAGATLTVITGCAAAAFSVRYPVDQ